MTPPDQPEEQPSALSRLERALAGFGEPREGASADEEPEGPPEEPEGAGGVDEADEADDVAEADEIVDDEDPDADDWEPAAAPAPTSVLDIASAVEAVERLSASRDAPPLPYFATEADEELSDDLSRSASADEFVFAATAAGTGSAYADEDEDDQEDEEDDAGSVDDDVPDDASGDEEPPVFAPADLRARIQEFAEEEAGEEELRVAVDEGSALAEAPAETTRDAAASWNRDLGDQQLPYFLVDEEPEVVAPAVPAEPVLTLEELRRRDAQPPKEPKPASVVRTLAEIPVLLIVAALIAFLVKTFLAQAYYIPSGSMLPQLRIDDRVVVSKLSYKLHDPRRGDIVVFDDPRNGASDDDDSGNVLRKIGEGIGIVQPSTDEFIKRVIGLPGDTVEGRDGHVYVNGRLLIEPYLVDTVVTSDFAKTKVREGHLWVMGDNRSGSADSRVFGQIEIDSIVGRAMVTVWPFGHIEFL